MSDFVLLLNCLNKPHANPTIIYEKIKEIHILAIGGTLEFPILSHVFLRCVARGLKSWIKEVEGLYYLCSKNKDADQLHSYHAADLHLCFPLGKKEVFFMMRPIYLSS